MADHEASVPACMPFASAPGCEAWAVRYDGPAAAADAAVAVAVDPTGFRVYVAGEGAGPDPDLFVMSNDAALGTQLWLQRAGGVGPDGAVGLAVSPTGQAVVLLANAPDSGSSTDVALLAFGAESGSPLWTTAYGNPAAQETGSAVAFGPDGTKVFAVGTRPNATGTDDMVVLAFAAGTGTLLWETRFGGLPGANESASSLAVSPDGSVVYVSGTAQAASNTDVVAAAYSASDGSEIWTAWSGHPADETARSLALTETGNRLLISAERGEPSEGISILAYDAFSGMGAWRAERDGPDRPWLAPDSLATDATRAFVLANVQEPEGAQSPPCPDDPDCLTDVLAVALDLDTGSTLWETQDGHPGRVDRAAAIQARIQDDRVYVAASHHAPLGPILASTRAFDGEDGHLDWFSETDGSSGQAWPLAMAVDPAGQRLYVAGAAQAGGESPDALARTHLLDPPSDPPSGSEDSLLAEEYWAFVRGGAAPSGQEFTLTTALVDDYARRFLAFASDEARDAQTNLTAFETYLNSTGLAAAPADVADAIVDLEGREAADTMWVAAKLVQLLYESSPEFRQDVASGYIQPWDAQFFFDWVFPRKRLDEGWDASREDLAEDIPPGNESAPRDEDLENYIRNLSVVAPIELPQEDVPDHLLAPAAVVGPIDLSLPARQPGPSGPDEGTPPGGSPSGARHAFSDGQGPAASAGSVLPLAGGAPLMTASMSAPDQPALHYTACFERAGTSAQCAAPTPWGAPTALDSNHDGTPDMVARFSLAPDPLHPLGISVDYALAHLGLVPPPAHVYVVFDTPGPPVVPSQPIRVAFGFDGRSSALPLTSRLQVSLNDLVAAAQGDVQISTNAEFALAAASAAVTFRVVNLLGAPSLPGFPAPPMVEFDPVVGSLGFAPVPPVFLLDARLRTLPNASRYDVRLQVPTPVRADFRLVSDDTVENSRENIWGTIDPLPMDLSTTIAFENKTRTAISYRATAPLPFVTVHVNSTKDLASPGDYNTTDFTGHDLPTQADLVINGSLELDYASSGRMGDASVRLANVSAGQTVDSTEFYGRNIPQTAQLDLVTSEGGDRLQIAYNASHVMDEAFVRVDEYVEGELDNRIEFQGNSIPERVDLDVRTPGRTIALLYQANRTMPSARVGVVDPEGWRIDADVVDVPDQLNLVMSYVKASRTWFVNWGASAPTTSLVVAAAFDDDDKVQKIAARLEGLPTSWFAQLSPQVLVLQSNAEPMLVADVTLTNHENVTRFPGAHVSFWYDESKDEMDASLRGTQLSRFAFHRSGEDLTFEADARVIGAVLLHADARSIDDEGDPEVLRADAVLNPAPGHLEVEKTGERFRFESDANFDLNLYVETGDAAALPLTPTPPLVRGVSARDGASSTGTATRVRLFLEGFPTSLEVDAALGRVSMASFRPPAGKNYLVLDAHLDDGPDGPFRVLARQNGLPSPASLDAAFASLETPQGQVVDLAFHSSAALGDFTADVTNATSAARIELSNVPAALDATATFGPVVSRVAWVASASIQRVMVGARLPDVALLDGAVELLQVPAWFDLAFGTQSVASLGYQGPWFDYEAAASTLDATAFVNADLFDDPNARVRLSVTDLGADASMEYANEELVVQSSPATAKLEIHVWIKQTIDKTFGGCFPQNCPWLRLRWGDHFRIKPLKLEDAFFKLESFTWLYIRLGLTTSIEGSYGRLDFGWSPASTANYDARMFLKIEIKIGPIKASISIFDHKINGLKPFNVYFNMATNHWSTGGDLWHWSTPIPCSIFPWRWYHVHVDVNPHPHRQANRWNGFSVSRPAPGEGGAWLVTPNPEGKFHQRLIEAGAGLFSPLGGGIMLSVPKCKH